MFVCDINNQCTMIIECLPDKNNTSIDIFIRNMIYSFQIFILPFYTELQVIKYFCVIT